MFSPGAAGFELKLVSSVALARSREAMHNSRDCCRGPWPQCGRVSPGDDPKDAQVILPMLQIGAVHVFHDPLMAGTGDIQELSKTREMVARATTALWHRLLTHYLPPHFSEAGHFRRSARSDRSWPSSKPFRGPT